MDQPLTLSNEFLPASYSLSLKIDLAKPNFQGKVSIPLLQNALHRSESHQSFELTLHAHKLVVILALLRSSGGAEEKAKVSYDRAKQTVTFTGSCKASTIEISFMGSISSIKTYNDETYGIFKTNYSDNLDGRSDNIVVATHTQPFGCRRIFPVIDEVTHKVSITLSITTKSTYKVASNAALDSKNIIDMSEDSLYQFKPTPPIASSVFGFVLGDLEYLDSTSTRIPLRAVVTRGDSSEMSYAMTVAETLFPLFEEVLGVPYPLEKLEIVTLPFLSDGAMENWGLITIIKDAILFEGQSLTPESKLQVRQLIAHQLTHQWIGNLVSIDDWTYYWLIEAFATFVGQYVLSLAAIESSDKDLYLLENFKLKSDMKKLDSIANLPLPSFYQHMQTLDVSLSAKTSTIFEKNAYDKGSVFLNMLSSLFSVQKDLSDLSGFFKAFKQVLEQFAFETIKPFQMWKTLNEFTSFDVLTFVHSWTRTPGFPHLHVSVKGDKIKIEQNRFFDTADVQDLMLENVPFHVPLALKVKDDKGEIRILDLMLSDRSIELDVSPSQLLTLNAGSGSYFSATYEEDIQKSILSNVGKNIYSRTELLGFINDYAASAQQMAATRKSGESTAQPVRFLFALCDTFAEASWDVDYHVLSAALTFVQRIKNLFLHFSEYTKVQKWLADFGHKLYHKLDKWDEVLLMTITSEYDSVEFQMRDSVLLLLSDEREAQTVCRKLFKNFTSSGISQKFVPRELLALMFNVTMATANMNEYKQILSLIKNADVSYLKYTNGTVTEVQTAAVSSLSFSTKKELLSKTLNFVNTNIDSKMIELALIGFLFKHEAVYRQMIWAWYKVNYDQWVNRSLRKGSDWSKQIGVTTTNISNLVLGEIMQSQPAEIAAFVEAKLKLPPHNLKETIAAIEKKNVERMLMAETYNFIL